MSTNSPYDVLRDNAGVLGSHGESIQPLFVANGISSNTMHAVRTGMNDEDRLY